MITDPELAAVLRAVIMVGCWSRGTAACGGGFTHHLQHSYACSSTVGGVEVVGRWWNGIWGRLARRDIWLIRQTRWLVRARQGDSESGTVLWWRYDSQQQAQAMVDRLIQADGPDSWRELPTDTRPDPTPPEHPREEDGATQGQLVSRPHRSSRRSDSDRRTRRC
jgi:hypothetical protein